ncbi:MAG: hypothetical protein OXF02_07725 [Simkaniaceae bacterium]|nr:hypothetical protein [Simkaniaceae bacterium]
MTTYPTKIASYTTHPSRIEQASETTTGTSVCATAEKTMRVIEEGTARGSSPLTRSHIPSIVHPEEPLPGIMPPGFAPSDTSVCTVGRFSLLKRVVKKVAPSAYGVLRRIYVIGCDTLRSLSNKHEIDRVDRRLRSAEHMAMVRVPSDDAGWTLEELALADALFPLSARKKVAERAMMAKGRKTRRTGGQKRRPCNKSMKSRHRPSKR